MTRSSEGKAYDKARIRYEVAKLEFAAKDSAAQRCSDRLASERERFPNDRVSIRRRIEALERAELKLQDARDRKNRAQRKLEDADRALGERWNMEYTNLCYRFPRETAEQIVSENNGSYPDSYYLEEARKEYDCDA